MSNQIITLTVPGIDQSDGPATNVSGLVGSKTVELSGQYAGSYTILGSHDGLSYAPLLVFDSGSGAQSVRQTTNAVVKFMKVRRKATNITAVGASVLGLTTTTNSFISLAPIPAGTNTGPLGSTDIWTVVPPTGIELGLSAICAGNFVGTIALEGSLDNVSFSPIEGGFLVGDGSGQKELSPLVTVDTVRFVRLNVLPGTKISGPVSVTIGGGLAPSSGGGGVALVHSGTAIFVDNTDPTNPIVNNTGVTSFNGNTGAVKGTLANIYAFGVADSLVTDNTMVGTISSMFFDSAGRLNVTTNAGQEGDSNPFVNLEHRVLAQGNEDFQHDTVRFLAASGVGTFAASVPTGWRHTYDLVLDATATTIHVAIERVATGNVTLGGAWWFPSGGIAPGQTPIVVEEVQLTRPDAVGVQISQRANTGTYAAQVFIPGTGVATAAAALVSAAVGDGANPPPAGSGVGWFVYAGFGTLPLLGMMNLIFDDTGFLTEKTHWEAWGTINDVPTRFATFGSVNKEGVGSSSGLFTYQANGVAAPVSAAGTAATRYNGTTNQLEYSKNGGPWTPFTATVGKFTGVLIPSGGGAASTFLGDPGSQPLINSNSSSNDEYPTSARVITKLWVCAMSGNGATAYTVTLWRRPSGGAMAATAMTVTVTAGAAAGQTFVDSAHPITFADGDTFALQAAIAASGEGPQVLSATLEGNVLL